jgi:threonine dehydrogenase-like Zn-dependent dehydrogenase
MVIDTLPVENQSTLAPVSLMKAARIILPGQLEIVNLPFPSPGEGEIRVRIEGCGVCASNLDPWAGKPWFSYPMEPGALGHEAWGTVDALGPGISDVAVGERVGFLSYHSYAEYDIASVNSFVRIPKNLNGTPFPAEPLGCAVNIYSRAQIARGSTVCIIGIGFLGALLTQLCSRAGAHVIAISRRADSLLMARRMGAAHVLSLGDNLQDVVSSVKELTNDSLSDVVIEATGKQQPLDLAGELTKTRGRLIIAGYHQDGARQVNMQLWNWRGIDVINAHERDPGIYQAGMKSAVDFIAEGLMDPSPLFTHYYPLERLDEALNATRDRPGGFFKALVIMNE